MVFHCKECEFECEKQITLNQQKNTKHKKMNSQISDSFFKATNSKEHFHCDGCNYSCLSKKSLKKHMSQNHEIPQTTRKIECKKCELTFQEETDFQTHVEEKHCLCTTDSVCDECAQYWAQKSQ